MRGRPDYNEYSVRLELQADFYAACGRTIQKVLHRCDIEEAMRAANAIGDNAFQKKAQGCVVPHSFTPGSTTHALVQQGPSQSKSKIMTPSQWLT